MAESTKTATGRIARVNGPVVDIEFPHDSIPDIYNALTTEVAFGDQKSTLTLEVAQHLGDDLVRAIAMQPTDGLVRGGQVHDSGNPIMVPVGPLTLGRIINVIGEPIDEKGPIATDKYLPIHRDAPSFQDQGTGSDLLITGKCPPHPAPISYIKFIIIK